MLGNILRLITFCRYIRYQTVPFYTGTNIWKLFEIQQKCPIFPRDFFISLKKNFATARNISSIAQFQQRDPDDFTVVEWFCFGFQKPFLKPNFLGFLETGPGGFARFLETGLEFLVSKLPNRIPDSTKIQHTSSSASVKSSTNLRIQLTQANYFTHLKLTFE